MPQLSSENLPLPQKKRLHKDFIGNERLYWRMREQLLKQYEGQWVAITDGKVAASGDNLFDVTDEVGRLGCHAYIARVGQEENLIFTIRREFAYDLTYQPFALPQAEVVFSNYQGTGRQAYPDVIPDTGADLSALPEDDCAVIGLFDSPYLLGLTRGVLGPSVTTLVYRGNAEINGASYPSLIQPIPGEKNESWAVMS